jgi:predicted Rossmann fold flavoprotein
VEDGGRVFPVSDNALDVLRGFGRYLDNAGVEVWLNAAVRELAAGEPAGFVATLSDGREIAADAVIVATGGLSAPHTGSSGDGYRIARDLGHGVTKLYPALVPLVVQAPNVSELMGLSMADIGLIAKRDGKGVYKDFGDVIFTHFGISGPVVLRTSAYLAKTLHLPHEIYLDFAPGHSEKDLDDDILRMFGHNPNRDVHNCLAERLPARLAAVLLAEAGIASNAKARDVTKEARRMLCRNIKAFRLEIAGPAGFGAAVITCGGVNCDEIDPSTMQSKLVPGLYFAGEVLDVDALTGGYNLMISFSTGRLAGKSAGLHGSAV